jgi:hypothetical protein
VKRRRIGRIAARAALAVGAVLVVLGALEITLRWRPTLLGQDFANGAATKYTTAVGGIYYLDRRLNMNFMLPDHRTVMYYNGYVWRHETDRLGFRNKPLHVPADVVLLGDSVVYGHGVDFEHTVGSYLERRSGLRVVNLGRQGDCAFQEAYLLTEYLPLFTPRVVVHVFTFNDIDDLYAYLHDEEMEAFIAQPVDRITYPPRTDPALILAKRERPAGIRSLLRWARHDLYVMKMFRWIEFRYRHWRDVAAVATAEAAGPPRRERVDLARANVDPQSLGWRYMEHALAYMKHLSDKAGARFVMAPYAQGRHVEILGAIAARHGIDLVDTAPLYAGPSFLPNDGHFTPHGARTMADLIAAELERLSIR